MVNDEPFSQSGNKSISNCVTVKKSKSKRKSANEINIGKAVNTTTANIRQRSLCSGGEKTQLKHNNVNKVPATHEVMKEGL